MSADGKFIPKVPKIQFYLIFWGLHASVLVSGLLKILPVSFLFDKVLLFSL